MWKSIDVVIHMKEASNDTGLCSDSTMEVVTPKTTQIVK